MKIRKKMKIKEKKEKKEKGEERNRDLNSWLQRLQQHVDSLEKRLDAVERRLSDKPFEGVRFGSKSILIEDEQKSNLSRIENEIANLKKEIESLKKDETVIISLKKGDVKKEIANIERRLERLEKKKAMVKVGKIEVPLEITGIVGGFIAFIIAILLFGGYKDIIVSPPFVMFVGIVLLTATALKTYLINIKK